MQLKNDVHDFGKACEHLLASVAIHRPLTGEERLLVRYYCNELLEKTAHPPFESK
jgi:hypothetical protein